MTTDSVLTACPLCGADVPSRYRFCGDCGAALGAPAAPGAASAETAPPAWRDERRVVAILFADLVGYTSFCEGRDPEEITLFVRELFRDFTAVIERHGGYVDKYIGDGVLALYGAPVAHGDDAERAVRAGLALIEVLRSRAPEGIGSLGIRVGVTWARSSWGRSPPRASATTP